MLRNAYPTNGHIPLRSRGKSWWRRWQPAWQIKFKSSAVRINYDIHRAFGLWTWAMLFVFAWSSVGFNLGEVYEPVMNALFGAPPESEQQSAVTPEPPTRPPLVGEPKLDWYQARDRGRDLLAEKARNQGFGIKHETLLALNRDTGHYTLCADTLAKGEASQACVDFDADTGSTAPEATKPGTAPEPERRLSDTFTGLLIELHMARIFGLPMKIFVCLMGLVITALSVTGLAIWRKKRQARLASRPW